MRKLVVVVVLIVGVTLMLWAGVRNGRERKLAMQKVQAPKVGASSKDDTVDAVAPKLTGKMAPGFTLVDLNGKKVSLADYKGHPVFVNFWATWCEPCKLEMPWLEEFSKKYAASGLVVLGISDDDGPKSLVESTAKKLGVTYPILLKDDKVETAYDIELDPQSFYVDKTGKVMLATAGIPSTGGKDEIEANIKKLIAAGGE